MVPSAKKKKRKAGFTDLIYTFLETLHFMFYMGCFFIKITPIKGFEYLIT